MGPNVPYRVFIGFCREFIRVWKKQRISQLIGTYKTVVYYFQDPIGPLCNFSDP